MIVRIGPAPGTLPALAPVAVELAARGHLVVADGPADVALVCRPEDALALARAGVRPLAYTATRANPGRGWARKLGALTAVVDLLLVPGREQASILHLVAPEFERFRIAGLPRVDALRSAASTRARIMAFHGLDAGRPLVVFAPRFFQRGALSKPRGHGTLPWLPSVCAAAEACGAELIVLPHPREHRDRRLQAARHVARVHDAQAYLCAADILISDFSPLAAEFAVRDRPIVQLLDGLAPRLDRLVGPYNPREHERFDVGVQVLAAALGPALAAACRGEDPSAGRRRGWVERLFGPLGHAAAAHVDALEELVAGQAGARLALPSAS